MALILRTLWEPIVIALGAYNLEYRVVVGIKFSDINGGSEILIIKYLEYNNSLQWRYSKMICNYLCENRSLKSDSGDR